MMKVHILRRLPVMLAALLPVFAGADENDSHVENLRLSCDRLQMELEGLKQRTESMKADIIALESNVEQARRLEEETSGLARESMVLLATRQDEIAKAEAALDALRAGLAGKELGTLVTVSGKSYEDVVVRSVPSEGVKITHRDGAAIVPKDELPEGLRRSYGYVLQDALDALKRRTLPAVANREGGLAPGNVPKIQSKEEILSQERHLTDSERFINAQAAEATRKRAEAKVILKDAAPGSELLKRAEKLLGEARQIEERLGLPPPKEY